MKTTSLSLKYSRQRRFLMILPLLTLPSLTLMFWVLGGGKVNEAKGNSALNLRLPDAKLKDDKTLNKLSFYNQAALDSAKAKAAEKLDPYWRVSSADSNNALMNNG